MSRTLFLASMMMVVSAPALAAGGIPMPVYGDDNRQDLYQVTDPMLQKLADSTVSLFQDTDLTSDATGRNFNFPFNTLAQAENVCTDQPFIDQPTAAFCSGSLVGPDLVLTAGHCVETMDACKTTRIAFGFAVKQAGVLPRTLLKTEVYSCKAIVSVQQQEPNGPDYALIRLDRKVLNHKPVKVNRTGSLAVGTPLVVIGHPTGLPEKVAGGARVLDVSDAHKFVANLDTYAGNSGSPVFNATTGLIEGILVTGEPDYVPRDPNNPDSCMINKVCSDDGVGCGPMNDTIPTQGERSTRASEFARFIPIVP